MDQQTLLSLLITIAAGAAALLITQVVLRIIPSGRNSIHVRFSGQIVKVVILVLCFFNILELFDASLSLQQIFVRGSALIVAIVGFAAQPVLSDMVCGYLISINKPFEIGDRIVVEGLEPGVVEDITLRHTVIRIYDGLRITIPNSQLNTKSVINTSYRQKRRGIHLHWSVAYDTDLSQAIHTIRDAVDASPYTLPVEHSGIEEDSGPVYFLSYTENAFVLETTIWVEPPTDNYVATTDVNVRVIKSFREHGIEIPYHYVNLVERELALPAPTKKHREETHPLKRHARTDTIRLTSEDGTKSALEAVDKFSSRQRMDARSAMQLRLLAEESVGIVRSLTDACPVSFWIEGSGMVCRIHLRAETSVDSDIYRKLLDLSTSGKNEAASTLRTLVLDRLFFGAEQLRSGGKSDGTYTWSLTDNGDGAADDAIGRSILAALSDDVSVSVTRSYFEVLISRTGADA